MRELTVKVTPAGPDVSFAENLHARIQKNAAIKTFAPGRNRLVNLEFFDDDEKSTKPGDTPSRFRATLYDYDKHRASGKTVTVEPNSSFAQSAELQVASTRAQVVLDSP